MKLSKLNKVLIVTGLVGIVGTAIATAIGTYKAYPKIKEGIDSGKKPIDIAKESAKDFAPAIGVVAVTGGCMVAGEILGDRKINELKSKASNFKRNYDKVSTWYKDQSEAINEKLSDKNKQLIEATVRDKEKKRYDETSHTEICTFYDPFTGVIFESTEGDILLAINDAVNRRLMITGYATYEDFYGYLGIDTPDDFKNFGWSFGTASAMWCNPWVDIQFADVEVEGQQLKEIQYISDFGQGKFLAFEPVEEPCDDGWN